MGEIRKLQELGCSESVALKVVFAWKTDISVQFFLLRYPDYIGVNYKNLLLLIYQK